MYQDEAKRNYKKYLVQELKCPVTGSRDFVKMYEKFAKRILWIDGNIVPGSFQMNTAWYYRVPERSPVFPAHVHEEDELIGFFGSNSEDPYSLNAQIEVAIDDETYLLTQSTLLFIPGNVPHMPMRILSVDRPVFHFSVLMGHIYEGGAYDGL